MKQNPKPANSASIAIDISGLIYLLNKWVILPAAIGIGIITALTGIKVAMSYKYHG